MTRYKILDELLSNKYKNYSLDDLTEEVNIQLNEMGISAVTRRCIEKDIKYIECDGPFYAEIQRYSVNGYNKEKQKSCIKKCLKYADPSFSIYKKEMSTDEKYLLSEALSLLGQFEGLPNLEALEGLQKGLGIKKNNKIISFSKNPLENSTILGELFTAISHKQVISIEYYTFQMPNESKHIVLHPYLLKEYNRRWYLFANDETDEKLLCFSLDRIKCIKPLPSYRYRECKENLDEYFDDIIGITKYDDKPIDNIVFWVSDNSKDYVITKPIHESQIHYKLEKDISFRTIYPMLNKGSFFSIDCIENYELIRELSSFGEDLLVLSPKNIRDKVYDKYSKMITAYDRLKK